MIQRNSLLHDGVWVFALHGFAALGQLWGLRWLTTVFPPQEYGVAILLLAAVALASTGLAGPILQTLLRYYPEFLLDGRAYWARRIATTQIYRFIIWAAPLWLSAVILAVTYRWISGFAAALMLALAGIEIWRAYTASLASAIRAQRMLGLSHVLESWGRPVCVWALVPLLGAGAETILLGYCLASGMAGVSLFMVLPRDTPSRASAEEGRIWRDQHWRYVWPLLPLGLVGWVSGVMDRFMIGGMLSAADVGVYAAVYGLCSRPLLMFSGMLETTIRPAYQQAVIEKNQAQARAYLKMWLVFFALGSGIGLLVVALAHNWLANLLLGEPYRFASHFAFWIVLGYSLLGLSHAFTRVCYANGKTKAVLAIESIGALASVLAGFILIRLLGLWGAVLAIPVYFGLQLAISMWVSREWIFPKKISVQ